MLRSRRRDEMTIRPNSGQEATPSVRHLAHLVVLAWVSMLGTDLLLHAGVLAWLYARPTPFLLDPATAFNRIPIGYASFLVLATLLAVLSVRLGVRDWKEGLRFGLLLGTAVWAALTMGLASISTASGPLLLGWFVGQTVELGLGGAVVGGGLQGVRPRRLWMLVVVWCVFAFGTTVLMQNLGLAPAAVVR